MTNQGVLTRRQFLIAAIAPWIAPAKSPLPKTPKPAFWFGDSVEFNYLDEISGEAHAERGEICGASWNHAESRWEYQVIWRSSTAYPASDYLVFDGNFVSADVLSKASVHDC